MNELTLAPPTTPPVAVATPAPRRKRTGRWIAITLTTVALIALTGLIVGERSTSSGLREDVADAEDTWRDIAVELDATKTELDATNAELDKTTTALGTETQRADTAEARGEQLEGDVAREKAARDAAVKENDQVAAERDAAEAEAAASAAALVAVETAAHNVYVAVFSHGDGAVTEELAECYVNDLVEFAGIPKLLEWDAIVAAGGELPPDGERAYGHAYFVCG